MLLVNFHIYEGRFLGATVITERCRHNERYMLNKGVMRLAVKNDDGKWSVVEDLKNDVFEACREFLRNGEPLVVRAKNTLFDQEKLGVKTRPQPVWLKKGEKIT